MILVRSTTEVLLNIFDTKVNRRHSSDWNKTNGLPNLFTNLIFSIIITALENFFRGITDFKNFLTPFE